MSNEPKTLDIAATRVANPILLIYVLKSKFTFNTYRRNVERSKVGFIASHKPLDYLEQRRDKLLVYLIS
uniref:Uncharacterized protein n=1 Tax=Pararge aegeria TaxID=116150 RepID=S4P5S8_9NEOP